MKNLRVVYSVLLLLSGILTATLGLATMFAPERTADGFGVALTGDPGVQLLMAVLGGAVLSLALVTLLAAWWSWHDRPEGKTLGMLCAATLILVALSAWLLGDSTQVLLLDGIRGTVLIVAGLLWRPGARA